MKTDHCLHISKPILLKGETKKKPFSQTLHIVTCGNFQREVIRSKQKSRYGYDSDAYCEIC